MMDLVKEYLIRTTAAAILCGIFLTIGPGKGINGQLLKMLCSVFLILTVASPVNGFSLSEIFEELPEYTRGGQAAADFGKKSAQEAWLSGIKASAEAYILDKAADYHADLEVEVKVAWLDVPVLTGVRISGNCSPYAKQQMIHVIARELGIREEAQKWTG